MPRPYVDALPDLGVASTLISMATVSFTYPQVTAVSKGMLPKPTVMNTGALLVKTMPFQIPVKFAQFSLMRTMKLNLDAKSPETKGLNTMVSYGSTGVPFQSVLYNKCISDIYRYHEKSPPGIPGQSWAEGAKTLFWTKVYPGIAWCFIRESCATGGALVLGPKIKPYVQNIIGEEKETACRFVSGLCAGACTAFMTQWIHNTALTAGAMAELGEAPTTRASFTKAVTQLGPSIIYKNYGKRLIVIAIASAVLNVFTIFD
eukprot:TRINITY_DN2491_c0_g1_i1.p1 TRINITY_DN2491_c0_g1~~TRINITY_DN2491_c0_g1_i1.p1  ORF type:complete len:260 (+),score=18.16 TRINITY_DN2491_c0_g1_i1:55-834(+)